jgi:hypothetical protein
MTKPKPINQTRRPRRASGHLLRDLLACPLCGGQVRVVAYRERSTRLACVACELRFSLDALAVADALRLRAETVAKGLSGDRAMRLAVGALFASGDPDATLDAVAGDGRAVFDAVTGYLQRAGDLIAYAAFAKPGDTPEGRNQRWARLHGQGR